MFKFMEFDVNQDEHWKVITLRPHFIDEDDYGDENYIHDLLIKGGRFYAIYNPISDCWITDFDEAVTAIMDYINAKMDEVQEQYSGYSVVLDSKLSSAKKIATQLKKYCTNRMIFSYNSDPQLVDMKILFDSDEVKRSDISSGIRLSYDPNQYGKFGCTTFIRTFASIFGGGEGFEKFCSFLRGCFEDDASSLEYPILVANYGSDHWKKGALLIDRFMKMMFEGYGGRLNNFRNVFRFPMRKVIWYSMAPGETLTDIRVRCIFGGDIVVNTPYAELYKQHFMSNVLILRDVTECFDDVGSGFMTRIEEINLVWDPNINFDITLEKLRKEIPRIAHYILNKYDPKLYGW